MDGLRFRAYGSLIALASLALLAVLALLLRRRGASAAAAVDLSILFLLAYLPGAHLLHAALAGTAPFVGGWPRSGFWGGQLVFLAFATAALLARRDIFDVLSDALAVAWAAATVLVKTGCFLAGCCGGLAGHPVALYEAGAAFALAVGLGAACLRGAGRGRLLLLWGLAYAALKFGLEFLRADARFPVFGVLNASMIVEGTAIAGGALLLARPELWRRLRADRPSPAAIAEPAPGVTFGWGLLLSATAAAAGLAVGSLASASAGRGVYVAVVAAAVLLFEGSSGMERLGVRLVDAEGRAPSAGRLALRAVASCLAPLTIVGLFRPLLDARGRGLPDALSGTRFVRGNNGGPPRVESA